jgi:transcriptional regulator with XRE-family HTH domain
MFGVSRMKHKESYRRPTMKFGDYIRQKREQKSWTQPEAAARADIEQSYLSKLETGKSYPSEDIFNRLVEVYDIDPSEMSSKIFSGELDKLREIKEVRTVVLERQKGEVQFVRSWMIAGLVFLMIGGASLGFTLIPKSFQTQFSYRSMGVLTPEEDLSAYQIVEGNIAGDFSSEEKKEFLIRQKAMSSRIDQEFKVTIIYRGETFVEPVDGGKRYYELFDTKEVLQGSQFDWFYIPALMFLVGSFGCFMISFRWK